MAALALPGSSRHTRTQQLRHRRRVGLEGALRSARLSARVASQEVAAVLHPRTAARAAAHCKAAHCKAAHCKAVRYTVAHCRAARCTAARYTVAHCTAAHCTAARCTVARCTAAHCTAARCTVARCTAARCTVARCMVARTAVHTAAHTAASTAERMSAGQTRTPRMAAVRRSTAHVALVAWMAAARRPKTMGHGPQLKQRLEDPTRPGPQQELHSREPPAPRPRSRDPPPPRPRSREPPPPRPLAAAAPVPA